LRPWKLDIHSASSIQNAKEILNTIQFDICFIDGYLEDGHGLDLIRWIQQEILTLSKIALISATEFEDIESIKFEYNIHFFLHKPVNRLELTDVIQNMLHFESGLSEENLFIKELREKFDQTIPQKLERIQSTIHKIQDESKEEDVEQLLHLLKQLTENVSSFGYHRT